MRLCPANLVIAAMLAVAPLALAQTGAAINPAAKAIALAAKLPTYDVVSIHENKSGDLNSSLDTTDDGFIAENATLSELVESAYNLGNQDLISGISGPLASAHFDIKAKIAAGDGSKSTKFTDDDFQAMVIPLLADRFHLKVRLVPKLMTVYEIVIAKGGPKLKLTEPETNLGSMNFGFNGDDNTFTAKKSSISDLADALSESTLHRIVVDRTGLKGEGDFSLKWTSDEAQEQGSPNAISVFTAIQDQLGLKLQTAKLPVDTLVIDHAEMPAEN